MKQKGLKKGVENAFNRCRGDVGIRVAGTRTHLEKKKRKLRAQTHNVVLVYECAR